MRRVWAAAQVAVLRVYQHRPQKPVPHRPVVVVVTMPLPSIHTADTTIRTTLEVNTDGYIAVTILPPASSRADLNAHAKEFVPSFSPSPPPQSPRKLTATLLSTTSTGVQLVAYYDEQGRYLYTGPYDPYIAGLADYAADAFDASTLPEGVDQAYVDAALAMLADAFPLYSTEQLFATFAEQVCHCYWLRWSLHPAPPVLSHHRVPSPGL